MASISDCSGKHQGRQSSRPNKNKPNRSNDQQRRNCQQTLRTSAKIGTVELTGLEMIRKHALGQLLEHWSAIPFTIDALVLKRSSLNESHSTKKTRKTRTRATEYIIRQVTVSLLQSKQVLALPIDQFPHRIRFTRNPFHAAWHAAASSLGVQGAHLPVTSAGASSYSCRYGGSYSYARTTGKTTRWQRVFPEDAAAVGKTQSQDDHSKSSRPARAAGSTRDSLLTSSTHRVMPGLRGTPAGMTTTSAPSNAAAISSAPLCPVTYDENMRRYGQDMTQGMGR